MTGPRFPKSQELAARLRKLVPGGAHTYAKADEQYPVNAPSVLARGRGCRVWDADGDEFIEYGMGLRAVALGHAFPEVNEAVRAALEAGTNFTRPGLLELQCAEAFLEAIETAEMVKFTKDGSTANTAALKLARKATGRDLVAIASDQPFLSYDDWFICTTTLDGGIPRDVRERTLRFRYNDLDSARALFERHPEGIAAVMLEAVRTEPPAPGFLEGLQGLCRERGALFILDEMITGFRWHRRGAQHLYGLRPDLSTFGKALANGFSLSALCGRREVMRLGAGEHSGEDVFLLSTTHGAESTALAAAVATLAVYQREPVVERLHQAGERLRAGAAQAARRHGVERLFEVLGRPSNLIFATRDPSGQPSQAFRTLFLQELISRGVIAPSFVVSYSHSDADIDQTLEAIDGALAVYARAASDGVEKFLQGRPVRPVFDRR
jgi:glutamate-1-semialdehyde 2,1-aminomutase